MSNDVAILVTITRRAREPRIQGQATSSSRRAQREFDADGRRLCPRLPFAENSRVDFGGSVKKQGALEPRKHRVLRSSLRVRLHFSRI